MVVPSHTIMPVHHVDLPPNCRPDYNEARSIFGVSPKAAAALLRLCIQKLMVSLGQSGENINADIKALVAAGLPVQVQQALDACRVIGNNAVHPGEIMIDEDPSIVASMFEMINFVVDDRITRPRQVAELYGRLPEGARAAVEKRDKKDA
ncbi:DUF4145 domain-containing protein [Pseudoxanthomonas sp.]|uniref:DUF4145 domain-containing protein n=1 Tax=Pseudoxanthomonas sp. TaxID=1871049 RepID=UPI003F80CB19